MSEKIRLAGRLDKTATWIWLEDGQFKVEYYDFSEQTHTFFGNDIAWTITVNDMEKLFSIVNKDEATLIPWMARYFKSYFGIKQWLEENEIECSVERETWA